LFDVDGTVFFTTGASGALQSTIDIATGRVLSEPKLVWSGTGGRYAEAPHLYRRGEWYYLLLAEGGTEHGHMVTIARSRSAWGPFEGCARNPILTHRSFNSPIQNVGHADLVDAGNGETWAVFLGTRPVGYPERHNLGRETFIAPVEWAQDGFPKIGTNGRVALEYQVAAAYEEQEATTAARDDFVESRLASCWNYLRNPVAENYSLDRRQGWLSLAGAAESLDDVASPTCVARRQAHHEVRVATLLDFSPRHAREEAGLSVRMNETHHYDLFVCLRGSQRAVVLRRRIGSLIAEERVVALAAGAVELCVAATAETYGFSIRTSAQQEISLGAGEARYLSTEVAGGFTGVFFALYATGAGQACAEWAHFDWFDYLPGLLEGRLS
jgi:alpha-N-arabinofuranosidase